MNYNTKVQKMLKSALKNFIKEDSSEDSSKVNSISSFVNDGDPKKIITYKNGLPNKDNAKDNKKKEIIRKGIKGLAELTKKAEKKNNSESTMQIQNTNNVDNNNKDKEIEDTLKVNLEKDYENFLIGVGTTIKKLDNDFKKVISTQLPDNMSKDGDIKIAEQIYGLFNEDEIKDGIISNVANTIYKKYEKNFKKDPSKNLELDSKEINEYIYNSMSEYLVGDLSKNIIKTTYEDNPFLQKGFVEKLFKKIDDIIHYYALEGKINTDSSDIKPISDDMRDINKTWKEFSQMISKEVAISSMDRVYVDTYKIITEYINSRLRDQTGLLSYDEIKSEGKISDDKMLLNEKDNTDSNTDDIDIKSIEGIEGLKDIKNFKNVGLRELKYEVIASYNNYRTNLYNKADEYVMFMENNKNLIYKIIENLNGENLDIKTVEDCNNILNKCLITASKNEDKDKKSKNENKEEIKVDADKILKTYNFICKMVYMYREKSEEMFQNIVKMWPNKKEKNNTKSIKSIVETLEDYMKYIKDSYNGEVITLFLMEHMNEYVKNEFGSNALDKDLFPPANENEDKDLHNFELLMGRTPSYDDINEYKETYRTLYDKIGTFAQLVHNYEDELKDKWYYPLSWKFNFASTYIIKRDARLDYRVLNILFSDPTIKSESLDFLRKALAYMHLSQFRNSHKNTENGTSYEIANKILGDTEITHEDISDLFAAATTVKPSTLTINNMVTILMSNTFMGREKIKCVMSFIPSKFYNSQPVVITSTDGNDFVGVITFYSFEKITNLLKSFTEGYSRMGKWLYDFIKNHKSETL